jgi:outer membrane protein OmpA-like peptidoglycan-associated protein
VLSIAPAFRVPAVHAALGRSAPPSPTIALPASPPTWIGAADDVAKGVDAVAAAVDPLLAAVTLAGFDADLVAFGEALTPGHLMLDLGSGGWQVLESELTEAAGQPSPPDVDAVAAVRLTGRRRFRPAAGVWDLGIDLSMPLPAVLAPSNPGPSSGGVQWLDEPTAAGFVARHDPRALDPAEDVSWWVIGFDLPGPFDLARLAEAARHAAVALGQLVVDDLVAAIPADPATPAPGLLDLVDATRWRFPDGPSGFQRQLVALGERVRTWLGRGPGGGGNAALRADFVRSETVAPTGSLELWLNLEAGGGSSSAAVDDLAWKAQELGVARSLGGVTERRVRGLLRLPWTQALMGLHELGLVDVLGAEQLGPTTAPEWRPEDLTGTYERRDPVTLEFEVVASGADPDDHGIGTDTLQLRVAGSSLRGYWQEHDRRTTGLRTITSWSLHATATSAGAPVFAGERSVRWDPTGRPDDGITIEVGIGTATVDMVSGGERITFLRLGPDITFDDDELSEVQAEPGAMELVAEVHTFPLHGWELDQLDTAATQMIADIDRLFDEAITPADFEAGFAPVVRPYVEVVGSTAPSISSQVEQARLVLRSRLAAATRPRGHWILFGGPTIDRLRLLREIWQEHGAMPTVAAFFEFDNVTSVFWYEWELLAEPITGVSGQVIAGLAVYPWATMTIRKWRFNPPDPDHQEWESKYWLAFVGVSAGPTIELTSGVETSGKSGWVLKDLSPDWFKWAFVSAAGVQGGALADVGRFPGLGTVVFRVAHPFGHNPQGNYFLFTNASGMTTTAGLYLGIEVAGWGGKLLPWEAGTADHLPIETGELDAAVHLDTADYTGADPGNRFFDTDEFELDEPTRAWLRELCLEHMSLLRDRYTTLAIVGHADPRASDEHNLELSRKRAISLYQGLADILGPHLHVRKELTFIGGRGEADAAGLDHPQDFPTDRRVDIHLGGSAVVGLHAPTEVPAP